MRGTVGRCRTQPWCSPPSLQPAHAASLADQATNHMTATAVGSSDAALLRRELGWLLGARNDGRARHCSGVLLRGWWRGLKGESSGASHTASHMRTNWLGQGREPRGADLVGGQEVIRGREGERAQQGRLAGLATCSACIAQRCLQVARDPAQRTCSGL
eukprot:1138489-Pelagomonas_calceolata.AAC.3